MYDRVTAMHYACSNGVMEFVSFLTVNGADLFMRDKVCVRVCVHM